MDAEIILNFEGAGIAESSLAPELNTVGERVEEKIERKGNTLRITLKAKDLVALKAAVNSYINWIGLSHKVIKDFESGGDVNGRYKP